MRRGRVILALFLILLGAYLLLQQLDIGVPDWDVMWPVLPLAGGLALLGGYIFGKRRDPGHVFLGALATLIGLLFFFVTLGPLNYEDLGGWWPAFALIGGAAFLAQWAASRCRDWGALFLALIALAFGIVGLVIKFEWLGPETSALLPKLWPVPIIVVGLLLLLRGLFGKRS